MNISLVYDKDKMWILSIDKTPPKIHLYIHTYNSDSVEELTNMIGNAYIIARRLTSVKAEPSKVTLPSLIDLKKQPKDFEKTLDLLLK